MGDPGGPEGGPCLRGDKGRSKAGRRHPPPPTRSTLGVVNYTTAGAVWLRQMAFELEIPEISGTIIRPRIGGNQGFWVIFYPCLQGHCHKKSPKGLLLSLRALRLQLNRGRRNAIPLKPDRLDRLGDKDD